MSAILDIRGTEVHWSCPYCAQGQWDNWSETTNPMCEECGSDYDWQELLTLAQEKQLAEAQRAQPPHKPVR